ncbi:MAG: polymerase sigma factor [Solirubrobacterales bacterium]|nr:polymerase sigma factor [Solirubrobacterales bacterium]
MGSPTDAELLAGDEHAFGSFYERHVGVVTAYVARSARRPEVTFDIVAETFARALEHRGRFDPQRGPGGIAWLLGIARNLLIDAARRGRVADAARVRLRLEPIQLDDEQLQRVHDRGRVDLRAALQNLPPLQQEAVVARIVADEPYPVIAARVGCSEQVIRQRVSRGLAQLRRTTQEGS